MTDRSSMGYYSDPERVALNEEKGRLKTEEGCLVCEHRDLAVICFEMRICKEHHSPDKGKKYCDFWELEND